MEEPARSSILQGVTNVVKSLAAAEKKKEGLG